MFCLYSLNIYEYEEYKDDTTKKQFLSNQSFESLYLFLKFEQYNVVGLEKNEYFDNTRKVSVYFLSVEKL